MKLKKQKRDLLGTCQDETLIEDIFGSVSEFARQIENSGDEFLYGNIDIEYNSNTDIHTFYKINQAIKEVKPVTKAIPKELEPLATEAKKYKSAEEFMKAQPVYYHGTNNAEKAKATGLMAGKNDNEYLANNFGTGIYLTETPENALRYGEVLSVLPKKKLKLRKLSNNEIIEIEFAEAKEKEEILDSMIAEDDYDGIKIKREDGEIEIVIFDDKLLDKPIDKITKFQLTYIYNQATKETRQEIEDETNRVIFPENYK